MIENVWKKISADPIMEGCCFKKVDPPSPDAASIKECRKLCAQNLCGEYGVTWGCPPGIGTEEKCLKTVGSFSNAALLIKEFNNIDLRDKDLIKKISTSHQTACRKLGLELRKEGYRALALTDGGCKYCDKCTYPDSPCRFPDQMVTSISAYGIMMDAYLRSQNIDFRFRDDGMTLYGLILYGK
ncbi:MAG: DUF2284 domain-containing protein [Candidatus Methanoplasma sp.]|jgi:predicted metal-binding protein|nr:DUF2284 domain-containing protein [Candidatus Methanoplasma sp.]